MGLNLLNLNNLNGLGGAGDFAPSQDFVSFVSGLSGLVRYYKMDETSGAVAVDSTGNANGTISDATVNQDGQVGKSYSFDGNDSVTFTSPAISSGTPMTIFGIAKYPNTNTGTRTLFGARTGNDLFKIGFGNTVPAFDYDTVENGGKVTSDIDITSEGWHLFVGTYDGSTIRFYINGVEVGTAVTGKTTAAIASTQGAIGRRADAAAEFFIGHAQHCGLIVGSYLTQAQIQTMTELAGLDGELETTLNPSVDTYIDSNAASSNNVNLTTMRIGELSGGAAVYRGLMKFDFSSLPAGAHIVSATLRLFDFNSDISENARTMRAYRVLKAWDVATWNQADTADNWNTAGCSNTTSDREATDIGSASFGADPANAYVEMELTASEVQEWIDGTLANNGLLLQMDTESNDAHLIISSNNSSSKPQLVLTYLV